MPRAVRKPLHGHADGRRELLLLEIPLGVLGAASICLAFLFARTGIPGWIPAAPITRTGLASPLSGMTRSFVALASGRVGDAFRWHPFGPVLFAMCLAAVIVAAVSWRRGARIDALRFLGRRSFWLVAAAVFAVVWVRQIVAFGANP